LKLFNADPNLVDTLDIPWPGADRNHSETLDSGSWAASNTQAQASGSNVCVTQCESVVGGGDEGGGQDQATALPAPIGDPLLPPIS
jgi:hypothetical protein